MKALSKREITALKKNFPAWKTNPKNTRISRSFSFDTHVDALVFIARITVHAEIMNHHPDITFTYKKVKVTVSTDEIKALSKLDVKMAGKIDGLRHSKVYN